MYFSFVFNFDFDLEFDVDFELEFDFIFDFVLVGWGLELGRCLFVLFVGIRVFREVGIVWLGSFFGWRVNNLGGEGG